MPALSRWSDWRLTPMPTNMLFGTRQPRISIPAGDTPVPARWLLIAWVLGMVSLPIVLWTIGMAALPWAVTLNVCLLATAVSLILIRHTTGRTAIRMIVTVLVGAWFIEWLGSTTGFPFGHYNYTGVLQPQVGGVPVLIPLAWLMMLPSTWVIGQLLAPFKRFAQAVLSALALTAWDFFLDPQMVGWDFWRWNTPGGYFGIPWVNFLGWFIAGLLLTLAAAPPRLPTMPLLLIYTITWFLQSIGLAAFWSMPGPALFGFIAMGLFVVAAWWFAYPTALRPKPSALPTNDMRTTDQ